jgi:hypothetical protein
MVTLYDLLGALPHDNAEDLRTAFRRAVKGAHPDVRPGDPEAALRFREIVRANEILGDPQQREAYAHLLELARQEQESASRRAIVARIYKPVSGAIALASASVLTVGGFLLFIHMSAASVAPAHHVDGIVRGSPASASVGLPWSADAIDNNALPGRLERSLPSDTDILRAAMSQTNMQTNMESMTAAADVGSASELGATEMRFLRARKISAVGDGDQNGRIAGLDQANELDPKFLPAYLDRGIIFFRPRKFSRAFPDLAPAKRIEKPSRFRAAMAAKSRFNQTVIAPLMTPFSQRRTAARDPSRKEWFR